ncbi:MAG: hypothetical protein ACSLFK_10550 [Gemmatimonadaceae bacterium]
MTALVRKARPVTAIAGVREKILSLPTHPARSYEDFDLNRLVVFVISSLDQMDVPATLENIAVAAHRLFPKRFALVGYPQFPDAVRVSRALLQLRPKYRNWATGKTRIGWSLNETGTAQARAVARALSASSSEPHELTDDDTAPEKDVRGDRTFGQDAELARIRRTALFAKYHANWNGAAVLEVFDVLNAYTHTPAAQLNKKLRELKSAAAEAGDDETLEFLKKLRTQFAAVFERQ